VRIRRSEKAPSLNGSIDLWHKRMGHLNKEAIWHLPEAAEGVIVTGNRSTNELEPLCEACHLSEIPRQISRRPMPRGTKPCERIHLDLICSSLQMLSLLIFNARFPLSLPRLSSSLHTCFQVRCISPAFPLVYSCFLEPFHFFLHLPVLLLHCLNSHNKSCSGRLTHKYIL
jgi:hypothetical protein